MCDFFFGFSEYLGRFCLLSEEMEVLKKGIKYITFTNAVLNTQKYLTN